MEPLQRDPYLWQKAKARAKFQSHLLTYIVINAGLWIIWAFTPQPDGLVPWPLWATAFWGFGLLMRGLGIYGGVNYRARAQREYERLVQEQHPDARR